MIAYSLESNLPEIYRAVLRLDGVYQKARRSAMSSVGFHFSGSRSFPGKIGEWMKSEGGGTWPKPSALSLERKSKYTERGVVFEKKRWIRRRKFPGSYAFLRKLIRYKVDSKGRAVQIAFGKSKRGQPGTIDPQLAVIAKRIQKERKFRLTPKMKRFLVLAKRRNYQRAGKSSFTVKARPIFDPVFAREKNKIPVLFQRKFDASFQRNLRRIRLTG